MGLTPTGGIPMGTRSGDLDPGVLLYLLRNENLSPDATRRSPQPPVRPLRLLQRRIRHAGTPRTRSLQRRLPPRSPSTPSATAIRKYIGAYAALLGGLDLLVFTGGIGEHSAPSAPASAPAQTAASISSASTPPKSSPYPRRKNSRLPATPVYSSAPETRQTAAQTRCTATFR